MQRQKCSSIVDEKALKRFEAGRVNCWQPGESDLSSLPPFPQFRPLSLADRFVLQPRLRARQSEISDRCFTNLFLWRDFYDIRISRYSGNICVLCASESTPEKPFFFPPLGDEDIGGCVKACFDYLRSRRFAPVIRRASEHFVLRHMAGTKEYEVQEDADISDYIYRTEDMIRLRGRRYHGQRNYIKRFEQNFPHHETEFISGRNVGECIRFNQDWLRKKLDRLAKKYGRRPDDSMEEVIFLKAEVETARKILVHFDALGLRGLAIRIDGNIRAFTVGEKLNDHMALIHIEKCDHDYLGINQVLTQRFCRLAWVDCEYVNRMEDLGIEGLRKAKQALGPHHMARKFHIFPKRQ